MRPERGAGSEKGLGIEREREVVVDDGVRLLGVYMVNNLPWASRASSRGILHEWSDGWMREVLAMT